MSSFRSWVVKNDRLSDFALQRGAAFLESRDPNFDGADCYGDALPVDFRARARGARAGVSGCVLHGLSGAGVSHDECAAKCVCQFIFVADSIQDHRQFGVRVAAALSHWELFGAYVLASMVRGIAVGAGVFLITVWFAKLSFVAPLWIVLFALLGAAILGTMGLIAGIWAEKFDQLAAFQNFLIVPATFLAGVFYSVHSLPPFWQAVSHANPFFYMIDGFRYGFFGHSDVPPAFSFGIVSVFFIVLAAIAVRLLKSGYKLRH